MQMVVSLQISWIDRLHNEGEGPRFGPARGTAKGTLMDQRTVNNWRI